jgi:hypothetical protein
MDKKKIVKILLGVLALLLFLSLVNNVLNTPRLPGTSNGASTSVVQAPDPVFEPHDYSHENEEAAKFGLTALAIVFVLAATSALLSPNNSRGG